MADEFKGDCSDSSACNAGGRGWHYGFLQRGAAAAADPLALRRPDLTRMRGEEQRPTSPNAGGGD
jgi:hypothetical protein